MGQLSLRLANLAIQTQFPALTILSNFSLGHVNKYNICVFCNTCSKINISLLKALAYIFTILDTIYFFFLFFIFFIIIFVKIKKIYITYKCDN